MFEQINIFDLLEPDKPKAFCWDNDINEIHKRLKDVCEKFNLKNSREDWRVWGHVPQFGYRLSFDIVVTKEILEQDDFWESINSVVEYAKSRNVELSPFEPYFFGGRNETAMTIFSTFMDPQRRKRKE